MSLIIFVALAATPQFASADSDNALLNGIGKIIACRALADDKTRLACFDKAISDLRGLVQTQDTRAENEKDDASSYSGKDFKTVDPDDIYVTPNKFKGKPITLTNAHCFYADTNDYRCIMATEPPFTIFANDVAPPDAKNAMEEHCGSIKDIAKAACRFTLHVVAKEFTADLVNGLQQRVVLRAGTIVVIHAEEHRWRHR